MVKILSIETSTSICSVAIHGDGELLSFLEIHEPGAHAEQLMLLIERVLSMAGCNFKEMDAIAVSGGPGSYTGLRIGVSTAKGLAFGLNRPLIGVNTLQALASAAPIKEGEYIIPVLDARRMEVYREVFDWELNSVDELKAEVISEECFQNFLKKGRVYFVGDAVQKVKSIVKSENAEFLTELSFSAKYMGEISLGKFKRKEFADLAYFVPNYLKEFKALHSKKNPLLNL
ncbi:tRNA (adenosine(37)-N6)-threonylcarbamoyltransferase complex dimerization subunit type 1 TsaB [Algoriphagus lacus]|uniref:tRNA (Adenosine(37)-N6)-threonylcarbamoyltransferase complex dimerization subunit type 1 TsaB n=1 Tax=Algoriphagus lacus TaxID=2056311 RepID=A0A418PTT5_9BACT|nr:tRNA (adenosine(37)-N6)-threonylcarbamoyltransferase complex dimerization subunit type 1 TsaB [Algoriphagus lacus]RIW16468.1 tRNA (adenosine(37)-N6)-threonylcarbamoyltransferase complex dimerization subunit type 1 TsaB [Algoriphagus lacus]